MSNPSMPAVPMETWRVFVAVPLSDEAVHQLTSLMSEAKGFSGPGVRWTGEGNLHLTLRFLGEVPVKQLDLIKKACQAAADSCQVLHLSLSGTGAFPSWRRPRVLWAGIGGEVPQLTALVARLERELESLVPPPDKPFAPHVTIARCRECPPALSSFWQKAGSRLELPFPAEKIILFRSRLLPGGAKYTPLFTAQLAPPSA